jgi:hypothetical protein
LQQEKAGYCKYCGSNEVTDAQITKEYSKSKAFQPEGKIGFGAFSAGGSLSLGNREGSTFSYAAKYCNKCYNSDLNTILDPFKPLKVNCLSCQLPVIIPYSLSTQLKTHQYSGEEIIKLILYSEEKFEKIYKKWSRKGTNRCRRGRLGYEARMFLKQNIEITCWIIMDYLDNELVFRLIYGGGKIHCP